MKTTVLLAAAVAMSATASAQVKDLGSGREVLWDMDRIADLGGGAALKLHHPELREVSLTHDAPWEGNVCCYHAILRDDVNYKMYSRGCAWKLPGYKNHQVVCYAESDDGVVWRKPEQKGSGMVAIVNCHTKETWQQQTE